VTSQETVVIVGAGQAGGELAAFLRKGGHAGRIVLVGEEPYLPYQRPPLSKAYLSGKTDLHALELRPAASYDKARIEVMPGARVERIERTARELVFADGRLGYDWLVLATGGRARRLGVPGEDLPQVHLLRGIADVDAIRARFVPGARVTIVGGGYIGLEVAAVAVKSGLAVTVLEALDRVLARVTAPQLSAFYERVHRDAGVDLRTGVAVRAIERDDQGVRVMCGDGSAVAADFVIVGIGLVPNTELAAAAGLAVDNGIVVDELTRTSDERILAIGDCSNHPHPIVGRRVRLESVPNAVEQARAAAALLCGQPHPPAAVPWFWSDQYDLKLQMVGLSQGHDHVVLRGNPDRRSFGTFYLLGRRILAADFVNRPPEFMITKKLVAERIEIDAERLADESVPLKALLERQHV